MKPLTPSDPAHIGPHRVLARLGAGGMGAVYLARTPEGHLAAVKVVHTELAQDQGFLARFARETRTAQRVRGPYTPAVLSASPEDRTPWMATEYVPGPTLSEAVAGRGPLPEASLRVLALGLARALQSVHASGIMHRDLKPGNVLLSPRGPQVIDFGIARAVEGTVLTKTGEAFGTPAYTCPETVLGREQSPASDVFALAGIVAFAASGRPPFGRKPAAEVLQRIVNDEPDLEGVPAGTLHDLLARCLAKDPAARPSADEIVNVLSSEPLPSAEHGWLPATVNAEIGERERELHRVVHEAPTAPGVAHTGRKRRGWIVVGAAATALVLMAGTAAAVLRPWEDADSGGTDEAAAPDDDGANEAEGDAAAEDEPSFPESVYGIHFTPDGEELYVHTPDEITVWDWREGELIDTPFGADDETNSFDLAESGHMATAGEDGLRIWDDSHQEVDSFDGGDIEFYDSVSLSDDGNLAAFRMVEQDSENSIAVVWDREEDAVVWEEEGDTHSTQLSPDGSHVMLENRYMAPYIRVVDPQSGDTVAEFPTDGGEPADNPLIDAAFAPDRPHIAVSDSETEQTVVYDLAAGETVEELDSPGTPMGLSYSPDGASLLAGRDDGVGVNGGFMWDTSSWESVVSESTLIFDKPLVHPDGETIAVVENSTGTGGATVLFLDPESGRDTHEIT
ncbi:protein kinase [Nocardiopsis sp. HNM0947]|uniref:Protein kinase n=1 Tax=Nocardiopsis coralli TaxID=2772213 RepID=A0ABR9P4X5_9ACTN|nr:serine/threonine-protein kinase [Nocardiopsis coralli]MBE2998893.1 protein kinase [Nocardiopsis coralli]